MNSSEVDFFFLFTLSIQRQWNRCPSGRDSSEYHEILGSSSFDLSYRWILSISCFPVWSRELIWKWIFFFSLFSIVESKWNRFPAGRNPSENYEALGLSNFEVWYRWIFIFLRTHGSRELIWIRNCYSFFFFFFENQKLGSPWVRNRGRSWNCQSSHGATIGCTESDP